MSDLISATLRDRADGDIHIERLLTAVHTGARRRLRRRIGLTVSAVVAAVAVAAGGGVAVVGTRGAPAPPATSPAPADHPADIPRPPLVEGAPVVAFTPTSLGADPTSFHLDLTGMNGWTMLSWSSRAGFERLYGASAETGGHFFVEASQSRDKLSDLDGDVRRARVNGARADLIQFKRAPDEPAGAGPWNGHAVRWEAAPGVWVQVQTPGGPEVALRVAARVRLDRTFRCAVPFRLAGLSDRTRMVMCEVRFSGDRVLGSVWLGNDDRDAEFYVTVDRPAKSPTPTGLIGDRAVTVVTPGNPTAGTRPDTTEHIEYPFAGGVAYFYPFYTAVDDPFLRSLVSAFEPVSDPDPQTWPRSPLP